MKINYLCLLFVIVLVFFNNLFLFSQETGDTNNDGSIDIIDALLVAQYYVGLDPENFIISVADTDCDALISIIDALLIAQYYVEIIPGFSECTPSPEPTDSPPTPEPTPESTIHRAGFLQNWDVSVSSSTRAMVTVTAYIEMVSINCYFEYWEEGTTGQVQSFSISFSGTVGSSTKGYSISDLLPDTTYIINLSYTVYSDTIETESGGQREFTTPES